MLDVAFNQFQTHCQQNILNFCTDFFRQTNVSFFYFNRYYNDGSSTFFSTNNAWVPYSFNNNFPLIAPEAETPIEPVFFQFLQENRLCNQAYIELSRVLSVSNFINLVYLRPGFVDLFAFAFPEDHVFSYSCVLNQTDKFKAFATEFTLSPFYREIESSKAPVIQVPEAMRPNFQGLERKGAMQLSFREKQCAYWITQGLSAKHISNKLNLSYRTIECHSNALKQKLNCSNKSELTAFLNQNKHLFF